VVVCVGCIAGECLSLGVTLEPGVGVGIECGDLHACLASVDSSLLYCGYGWWCAVRGRSGIGSVGFGVVKRGVGTFRVCVTSYLLVVGTSTASGRSICVERELLAFRLGIL
jgi:hypothetical protein